jgi:GNAT superfamily N-acetyltransferase
MKFYRHYKNKPYKYLGVVKHSETLEDLVLYECRYPNPTGLVWVRPKDMFFENIELNGKSVPRFEKVKIDIQNFEKVLPEHIQQIAPLIKASFGEWDENWFNSTFKNHSKFFLQLVLIDEKPAAFKLGYELDQWCFYSWLGGVNPEFRGLGIAQELMAQQHDWCKRQGYRQVQTKTQNNFKEMLMLDLQNGFDIIGTHLSETGATKIVLSKKL